MLTEIYLCHACSCQEILRTETAGQVLQRGDPSPSPHHNASSPPSAAASSSVVHQVCRAAVEQAARNITIECGGERGDLGPQCNAARAGETKTKQPDCRPALN
jgi:hypothetical protein